MIDPIPVYMSFSNRRSQNVIDELREGDMITFGMSWNFPHVAKKTRTRTKEVQKNGKGEMFIMDYSPTPIQELFNTKKIVEIRHKQWA